MTDRPLRIALLSYRGNPFCGGQGVYVRQLGRELVRLGHHVDVLAGQPYPDLDPGVRLVRVPSLDLYREPEPFRTPGPGEYRDWVDLLEVATMMTAGFPEPLTFSLRARRLLAARRSRYDVVHDNQGLGYGLLDLARHGLPLVATVHHPVQIDRRLDLAAATGLRRVTLRRWYGFTRMQRRVVRRITDLVTVSEASRAEIVAHLGVPADRIEVVPIGTDADLFAPDPGVARVPGRIVTTASADVPLKGLLPLVEATAKLRTERPVELVVVGTARAGGPVRAAVDRYGLADAVRFTGRIPHADLVDELRRAEVAVVPSLFEGFSLPLVEAMSCGVPVVATTGGALPEVAGPDGEAALLVPPGDVAALAVAIGRLLDDAGLRHRLGAAGRARVLRHYTWRVAAERTVRVYRRAIAAAAC
ncbi:glycosyltransferase family 4 protein [Solwaraspora sp. WMMD1047]|uniref:glycosyltransferase family 4 protein n=1 Tax=Solwaraspora sp. WMMD1047 TaxID=3016102 RepID=UPI002417531B|nr:glycosyltransferase family 4 protein [Solwaraspora sp. WMMD1047]MDG4830134.1 glycosyltransferase family 4 protein [Solwaraspora sp. WMMD1047]